MHAVVAHPTADAPRRLVNGRVEVTPGGVTVALALYNHERANEFDVDLPLPVRSLHRMVVRGRLISSVIKCVVFSSFEPPQKNVKHEENICLRGEAVIIGHLQ